MAKKRDAYFIDGVRVPGVSDVKGVLAKPALIPWAAKVTVHTLGGKEIYPDDMVVPGLWQAGKSYEATEIEARLTEAKRSHTVRKESAGEFGDNVHEIVSTYIDGQLKPKNVKDKKERKALENFIKVTKGWVWHASEVVVLNKKYMYGGTSDGLATLPNGMVIIPDIKTSGGVWPEFSLQIAMYSHPDSIPHDDDPVKEKLLRELWPKIEQGRILHFDKERMTWELLDRDVKAHYPFIPHFKKVYDWTQRFAHK